MWRLSENNFFVCWNWRLALHMPGTRDFCSSVWSWNKCNCLQNIIFINGLHSWDEIACIHWVGNWVDLTAILETAMNKMLHNEFSIKKWVLHDHRLHSNAQISLIEPISHCNAEICVLQIGNFKLWMLILKNWKRKLFLQL